MYHIQDSLVSEVNGLVLCIIVEHETSPYIAEFDLVYIDRRKHILEHGSHQFEV